MLLIVLSDTSSVQSANAAHQRWSVHLEVRTWWRAHRGWCLSAVCLLQRAEKQTDKLDASAYRLPKVVAVYGALPGWDATTCAVWGVIVILIGLVVPEVVVFRAEQSERRRFLCELSTARTPHASASCKPRD